MAWLDTITRNSALNQRDFRLLSVDSVCYASGTGGEQVIFSLLIFQITGSSTWVGVAFALYYLSLLVVGVPAGALADWMPRRVLMRAVQLALAIGFVIIGALVARGLVELWHILLMTTISGAIRATYNPVRLSYAYDLVGDKHLLQGLALIQIGNRVGQGLGAVVAGSIMQRLGPEHAYVTMAGAHFFAFFLLARLRTAGGVSKHERTSLGRTFVDYAQEVRHNRTLLVLIAITAGVNVFGFSFVSALPELATERFGVGAEGLGLLYAARAVGGMLAAGVLVLWGGRWRQGILYLFVIYAFGGGLVMLALSPGMAWALGVILIVAASASLTDVVSQSMMQRCVPNRLRGRAMGAWMLAIGVNPVGHLLIGALAGSLGAGTAIALNGVALICCAVAIMFIAPRMLRL